MQFSHPAGAVSPGLHGRVLTILARTEEPLTGRTITSLIHPRVSHVGVGKVLKDLERNGLVTVRRAGAANLYTINRDHVAYPVVDLMSRLRDTLMSRISAEVAAWTVPSVAVWMYGSAARGEAGPTSDIDLLVVRPDDIHNTNEDWLRQLDTLSQNVLRWSGNPCEILELSVDELQELIQRQGRLVEDLRRDAIGLAGVSPLDTLRRKVHR